MEIIALNRQGTQQERPESPTVTPYRMWVNTRYINSRKETSSKWESHKTEISTLTTVVHAISAESIIDQIQRTHHINLQSYSHFPQPSSSAWCSQRCRRGPPGRCHPAAGWWLSPDAWTSALAAHVTRRFMKHQDQVLNTCNLNNLQFLMLIFNCHQRMEQGRQEDAGKKRRKGGGGDSWEAITSANLFKQCSSMDCAVRVNMWGAPAMRTHVWCPSASK